MNNSPSRRDILKLSGLGMAYAALRTSPVVTALMAACREEIIPCTPDNADLTGEGRPTIEPAFPNAENPDAQPLNGESPTYFLHYRVPDFDANQLPNFEATCEKWPLMACARVTLQIKRIEKGVDSEDYQRVIGQTEVLLGEQWIYQAGEGEMPVTIPSQIQTADGQTIVFDENTEFTILGYRLLLLDPYQVPAPGASMNNVAPLYESGFVNVRYA